MHDSDQEEVIGIFKVRGIEQVHVTLLSVTVGLP